MSNYLKNLRALVAEEERRVWDLLLQVKAGPVRESLNWARSHLKAALNEVDGQLEAAESQETP